MERGKEGKGKGGRKGVRGGYGGREGVRGVYGGRKEVMTPVET